MSKGATPRLDEMMKTPVFKVPPGYFENLTENVMTRLPERIREDVKEVSLWKKIQPWVYMAAMFSGIALMVNLFIPAPESQSEVLAKEGLQMVSGEEIDEFYSYYEEQLADEEYRETFYLEELPVDSQ